LRALVSSRYKNASSLGASISNHGATYGLTMNRKLRRAGRRGGKRPAATQPAPQVDPRFIKALLEQDRCCLARDVKTRQRNLPYASCAFRRRRKRRSFFVDCVETVEVFSRCRAIRDVLPAPCAEAWRNRMSFSTSQGNTHGGSRNRSRDWARSGCVAAPPSLHELLGPMGLAQVAIDQLLLALLERGTVFDLEIERFLTSIRACLLEIVMQDRGLHDEGIVGLCWRLGRQCYINEYVFDLATDENDRAHELQDRISRALEVNAAFRRWRSRCCPPIRGSIVCLQRHCSSEHGQKV